MERDPKANPTAHQPSKAELEEDARIDAAPEALAGAVTRGGAKRHMAVNLASTVTNNQSRENNK